MIPFQLVVVSDFTALHALVMEDLTAAVAEVTLDFTAAKLVWMVVLMLFHVLVVLVVMELHADLIAALTPAVPVFTVWLMAAQLLLYACSTPLMELVMEVDSVVDRFSAAAVTRLVLVVMPFASPCMKSGIQLSISANGPSSGRCECRDEIRMEFHYNQYHEHMEQHQDHHPDQLCGGEIQCDLCDSSCQIFHD